MDYLNWLFGGYGITILLGLLGLWHKMGKYQNIIDS